jgi:hypothetical protein
VQLLTVDSPSLPQPSTAATVVAPTNQNSNLDTFLVVTTFINLPSAPVAASPDPHLTSATVVTFPSSDSDTAHHSLTKKEAFNWAGPPPVEH